MFAGPAADELKETANVHYNAFWDLREHFRQSGTQLFQLTKKSHANAHVCDGAYELNPVLAWCFLSH